MGKDNLGIGDQRNMLQTPDDAGESTFSFLGLLIAATRVRESFVFLRDSVNHTVW